MTSLRDPWAYDKDPLEEVKNYIDRLSSQLDRLRRLKGELEKKLTYLNERRRRLDRIISELGRLGYGSEEMMRERLILDFHTTVVSISLEVVKSHIEYLESERGMLFTCLEVMRGMDRSKLRRLMEIMSTYTIPIRILPSIVNILHILGVI